MGSLKPPILAYKTIMYTLPSYTFKVPYRFKVVHYSLTANENSCYPNEFDCSHALQFIYGYPADTMNVERACKRGKCACS